MAECGEFQMVIVGFKVKDTIKMIRNRWSYVTSVFLKIVQKSRNRCSSSASGIEKKLCESVIMICWLLNY